MGGFVSPASIKVAGPEGAGTTTVTSVDASTTVVTLLVANEGRIGVTIYNASLKDLYLKYGTGASTSLYSVLVPSKSYLETPPHYAGDITGVWEPGANKSAMVTEFRT